MLKAFLQRRRIKKAMERYVSPDIVRKLLDGTLAESAPNHVERTIEFAFVAISASDAQNYSECAGAVADIALQHQGVVQSVIPVVIVTFGSIFEAPSGSRVHFISKVQSQFPDSAAILHGSIVASVGNFGGNRMTFGFWWPYAVEALRQLALLSPGEAREFVK